MHKRGILIDTSPILPVSSYPGGIAASSVPGTERKARRMRSPAEIATHVLAVTCIGFVWVWSLHFRGGVAWNTAVKAHIFNLHPAMMITFFVVLSGEGTLVYRLLPGTKQFRKAVHLGVQACALVLGGVGIWAAFRFHNESKPPIDNLYSLHSWVGLTTFVLFATQWLVGFYSFWYPGAAPQNRARVLPWHTFAGVFLLVLAMTAASLGILEKLTFLQSGGQLGHYSTEAMWANVLGLAVIAFTASVILTALQVDKGRENDFRPLE